MNAPKLIGILGGTFDPIHNGHLHVATSVLKQLSLDEVRLLPCYHPVHRAAPMASPEDRLAMAQLACATFPGITVDDHEIQRRGQSYMIDTLRDLKQENTSNHLCLILGQDSFQAFDQWHEWKKILDYCHLIVVNRPNTLPHYSHNIENLIQHHQTHLMSTLTLAPVGNLFFCEIPPLDISATHLRQQLREHLFDEKAISHPVYEYIQQHKLYTISC